MLVAVSTKPGVCGSIRCDKVGPGLSTVLPVFLSLVAMWLVQSECLGLRTYCPLDKFIEAGVEKPRWHVLALGGAFLLASCEACSFLTWIPWVACMFYLWTEVQNTRTGEAGQQHTAESAGHQQENQQSSQIGFLSTGLIDAWGHSNMI